MDMLGALVGQEPANANVTSLVQMHGAASGRTAPADRAIWGRYCAWRGASDRRYVTTVYPTDRCVVGAGLPEFSNFVLIAVAHRAGGRQILGTWAIERDSECRAAVARGLACGAQEWHVHLLADDRRGRAAMVADLIARHGAPDQARYA